MIKERYTGKVTQENKDLRSRLFNWKFETGARLYLEGESDFVKYLVGRLAKEFGNLGWTWDDSMHSEMIRCTVHLLIGEWPEDEFEEGWDENWDAEDIEGGAEVAFFYDSEDDKK